MTISFIAAASENNVIGSKNGLPWRLPDDLKYFKNTTWGMPVIMGRKTFESFKKMLKGRTNIVITRQQDFTAEGATVVPDIEKALERARDTDAKECFIIGGGEIFKQELTKADKIYLTRVHTTVDGDTFFPELDDAQWQLVANRDLDADDTNQFPFSFQIWQRIPGSA